MLVPNGSQAAQLTSIWVPQDTALNQVEIQRRECTKAEKLVGKDKHAVTGIDFSASHKTTLYTGWQVCRG